MGFKNFNWLLALKIIAPIALAFVPQVPKTLIPVIVAGISEAEQIGGSGTEKKAIVVSAIEQHTSAPGISPELSLAIDHIVAGTNQLATATENR